MEDFIHPVVNEGSNTIMQPYQGTFKKFRFRDNDTLECWVWSKLSITCKSEGDFLTEKKITCISSSQKSTH